jgi:hypothetical protein
MTLGFDFILGNTRPKVLDDEVTLLIVFTANIPSPKQGLATCYAFGALCRLIMISRAFSLELQ